MWITSWDESFSLLLSSSQKLPFRKLDGITFIAPHTRYISWRQESCCSEPKRKSNTFTRFSYNTITAAIRMRNGTFWFFFHSSPLHPNVLDLRWKICVTLVTYFSLPPFGRTKGSSKSQLHSFARLWSQYKSCHSFTNSVSTIDSPSFFFRLLLLLLTSDFPIKKSFWKGQLSVCNKASCRERKKATKVLQL